MKTSRSTKSLKSSLEMKSLIGSCRCCELSEAKSLGRRMKLQDSFHSIWFRHRWMLAQSMTETLPLITSISSSNPLTWGLSDVFRTELCTLHHQYHVDVSNCLDIMQNKEMLERLYFVLLSHIQCNGVHQPRGAQCSASLRK